MFIFRFHSFFPHTILTLTVPRNLQKDIQGQQEDIDFRLHQCDNSALKLN